MVVFAIWPVIVTIFWFGIGLHYRIRPCNPGLLVGFCGLGLFMFRVMLIESVLLYTILFAIWRWVKKKRNKPFTWVDAVTSGMLSALIVFGGFLFKNSPLTYLSLPFGVLPLFLFGSLP